MARLNISMPDELRAYIEASCSRFGRVELLISSHPAQAGLFSTRPGENPA